MTTKKAAESAASDQPRKLSNVDDTTRYGRLQHTSLQCDSSKTMRPRVAARPRKKSEIRGLVLDGAVQRLGAHFERAGGVRRAVDAGDLRGVELLLVLRFLRGRIAGLLVEHRTVGQIRGAAVRAAVRVRIGCLRGQSLLEVDVEVRSGAGAAEEAGDVGLLEGQRREVVHLLVTDRIA